MRVLRRIVPYTLLPLSLVACGLASSPWLRAFPSAVLSVPLFGAALLSVLVPLITVGIGIRRLWLTALADVVIAVFYELLVTLREPVGFDHLYAGLVHGPSQILSFALPLMSPRSLMVAPVALCWLTGALIGECVARGWQSVLPYAAMLATFGLSYAGTARAVTSADDGRRYDTLLAALLLVTLLLLRAAQAWVVQEESAETTEPEGILPLRGLAIGTVASVAIAAAAAGLVQTSPFSGPPTTPNRRPPVDASRPLTPVSFVGGLRPTDPANRGQPLFKITTSGPTSNYVSLANVNFYDGDGWSFTRTFRPSGGVIPIDTDPQLRAPGRPVTQTYSILPGPMTTVPWMPYLDRAQKVTGVSVNIDPDSGMIVPATPLRAGAQYSVSSRVPNKNLDEVGPEALVGTSALPGDTTLDSDLSAPLGTLVDSLATETGTPTTRPLAFLEAVAQQFRTTSSLAGAPTSATPTPSPSPTASRSSSVARHSSAPARPKKKRPGGRFLAPIGPALVPSGPATPSPTPSAAASSRSTGHTGGTTFADVLASIRASHAATPEQYATLTALIARRLGVPARLVAGFRVTPPPGSRTLPAGSYTVTTAEAWTWVELPIRGLGWVVLDPSPSAYSGQQPQPSGGATPAPSPSPTPSQNVQLTQSNQGGNAVAKPSTTPHSSGLTATEVVLIVLAVVIVVALLLLAVLLGRKQLRARRRRRRGDPRRRLLGAWQESLDVLVEAGLPELGTLTSAEVAATTAERFGTEPGAQARYLGDAANAAIFSPTTWVGPSEADAAWRAQAGLSKAVRRRLGWRGRIRARLRYHRPRRPRPLVGPTSWAALARARTTTGAARGRHATPRRRSRQR